jgi:hypothetical protein
LLAEQLLSKALSKSVALSADWLTLCSSILSEDLIRAQPIQKQITRLLWKVHFSVSKNSKEFILKRILVFISVEGLRLGALQ